MCVPTQRELCCPACRRLATSSCRCGRAEAADPGPRLRLGAAALRLRTVHTARRVHHGPRRWPRPRGPSRSAGRRQRRPTWSCTAIRQTAAPTGMRRCRQLDERARRLLGVVASHKTMASAVGRWAASCNTSCDWESGWSQTKFLRRRGSSTARRRVRTVRIARASPSSTARRTRAAAPLAAAAVSAAAAAAQAQAQAAAQAAAQALATGSNCLARLRRCRWRDSGRGWAIDWR